MITKVKPIKLMALSLLLFTGCDEITTPAQLERAIILSTKYDERFLNCQERALISKRWLKEHGYKASTCFEASEKYPDHVSIKWEKDGKSGYILRPNKTGYKILYCGG